MARRIRSFFALRSHANSASSVCRMLRADSSSRARTAARTSCATAVFRASFESAQCMDEDADDMSQLVFERVCWFHSSPSRQLRKLFKAPPERRFVQTDMSIAGLRWAKVDDLSASLQSFLVEQPPSGVSDNDGDQESLAAAPPPRNGALSLAAERQALLAAALQARPASGRRAVRPTPRALPTPHASSSSSSSPLSPSASAAMSPADREGGTRARQGSAGRGRPNGEAPSPAHGESGEFQHRMRQSLADSVRNYFQEQTDGMASTYGSWRSPLLRFFRFAHNVLEKHSHFSLFFASVKFVDF